LYRVGQLRAVVTSVGHTVEIAIGALIVERARITRVADPVAVSIGLV
jgi:hypothetical protein